ncbi:MAG: hypothetical protein R3C03_17770 [Pirellulaceae bacterium]
MDAKIEVVRSKLAHAARVLADVKSVKLDELKSNARDLEREDFIWHYLLQSFSTQGNSKGYFGLIQNPANYELVRYPKIGSIPAADREQHLFQVLKASKVRYPSVKARNLVKCFDIISGMGGLKSARDRLLECAGRDGKVKFLKQFPGIGEKYARNMMMDVYHEEFRDSIAIDSRIESISEAWGLDFNRYDGHEGFYLSVADRAGLNGWELDRLLYWFTEFFKPPVTISE